MKKLSSRVRIAACLAFLPALAACGGSAEEAAPVIRPVRTETVEPASDMRRRSFSGVAQSASEKNLSFRVGGVIIELPARVGQRVAEGEILARLDATDYELKVGEADASLKQAQAEARNARAEYERTRALYENSNASRSDLDAVRAMAESSAATVSAAEQRLQLARKELEYTILRAPAAGAIADVPVTTNENLLAGRTAVVLSSGERTEVMVSVPAQVITQVREGEVVDVSFNALPDHDFRAEVTEVGVSATGAATTFPVTAALLEEDPAVLPGMAAEVIFRARPGAKKEIVVPAVAVGQARDGSRFVLVVEPGADGLATVHRRAVTIGPIHSDGMVIRSGLAAGDVIVTAGVRRLQDGATVRLPGAREGGR